MNEIHFRVTNAAPAPKEGIVSGQGQKYASSDGPGPYAPVNELLSSNTVFQSVSFLASVTKFAETMEAHT